MQVNQLSINTKMYKPNFKRIHTGILLSKEIRKPNCPKEFVKKYVNYLRIFSREKMRKTQNIDFILDYTKEDGFHMYIGTKNNKYILSNTDDKYFKNIDWSEECISRLKKWMSYWDKFYENVDTTFK